MLYTWDFSRLRNLAPLDGSEVKTKVENPKALPTWMKGLASRETRPLSQAEIRGLPFSMHQVRHEVVDRILPEGKAWIEAVYENLDKRFPHGESGAGFFFYESSRGVCLIYDPGVDMHSEWSRIFGVTAPPFTDCWRAPLTFRPWTSKSLSPTVFFNGNREDWASTDSLGAPYFSKVSVQTQIDWAYALTENAEELVPGILSTLGRAAVAWQCRVQPPAL